MARAPAPRDRLVRHAPAREPERQGLRAHAADEARRAAARPARRGPAAARPAAPRARARRAPAHRHGVAGLARRRARADPLAAGGGGVPGGTVGGRGPAGLPARLARHAGHDRRVDQRSGRAARAPADRAARQGRLLGPRDRRGRPARLAAAGVRGQGRLRPQLRVPHARADRPPRRGLRAAAGDRLAQPPLGLARDRLQPPRRRRRRRHRDADPARARRPAAGRDRRPGPARARLLPGRRPRGRHGLPRAAAAREHEQRLVPAGAGARRGDLASCSPSRSRRTA